MNVCLITLSASEVWRDGETEPEKIQCLHLCRFCRNCGSHAAADRFSGRRISQICTVGNKDGIEAAAESKAAFPDIKIIIVTSMVEVSYLKRAKAANVDSFWYKDISPEALIDVIDRTMAGEHLFPDETPIVKLGLAESTDLTAKEIEVLRLVCDGLEYSEIAQALNIAERTAKYHISNILSKTGYANKTRLAIAVTNKKFIIPSIPEDKEFDAAK